MPGWAFCLAQRGTMQYLTGALTLSPCLLLVKVGFRLTSGISTVPVRAFDTRCLFPRPSHLVGCQRLFFLSLAHNFDNSKGIRYIGMFVLAKYPGRDRHDVWNNQ